MHGGGARILVWWLGITFVRTWTCISGLINVPRWPAAGCGDGGLDIFDTDWEIQEQQYFQAIHCGTLIGGGGGYITCSFLSECPETIFTSDPLLFWRDCFAPSRRKERKASYWRLVESIPSCVSLVYYFDRLLYRWEGDPLPVIQFLIPQSNIFGAVWCVCWW